MNIKNLTSLSTEEIDHIKHVANTLISYGYNVDNIIKFINDKIPDYNNSCSRRAQMRDIVNNQVRWCGGKSSKCNNQSNTNIPIQFNLIVLSKASHYIIEYPIPGFSREHVKTAKVYKANDATYIRIECEKPCTNTYVQHDIKNVLKFDHDITAIAKNGIDKLLAKVNDGMLTIEIITKQHECYDDIPFA